jgi:hypothetical protein
MDDIREVLRFVDAPAQNGHSAEHGRQRDEL